MKRSLLRVDRLEDRCVPAAILVAGDVLPPADLSTVDITSGDDASMQQDGDSYSFVIDPYLIDPNAPPPPSSDPIPDDGWTIPPDESPVPPIDDPFWY